MDRLGNTSRRMRVPFAKINATAQHAAQRDLVAEHPFNIILKRGALPAASRGWLSGQRRSEPIRRAKGVVHSCLNTRHGVAFSG